MVSAVLWWVLRVEWWVEKQGERDFPITGPNARPSTLPQETTGREGVLCQNEVNWETGRRETLALRSTRKTSTRNSWVMAKGSLRHHVLQAWKAAFADWKPTDENSMRQCFKKKKNETARLPGEFCSMYFVKCQQQHSLFQPLHLKMAFRKKIHSGVFSGQAWFGHSPSIRQLFLKSCPRNPEFIMSATGWVSLCINAT